MLRKLKWLIHLILTLNIRRRFKTIGKNVYIHPSVKFSGLGNIKVGDNVRIGKSSDIRGTGGLTIGFNCSIAPNCTIITTVHNFKEAELLPYDYKKIARPVLIGNNVWIGQNVSINPNVTIGDGAIVGLAAVVVKDVPSLTIVGGNPAKTIGIRNEIHYNQLVVNNKYYDLRVAGKKMALVGGDGDKPK